MVYITGRGWRLEPERHRLSALGYRTGRRADEKTSLMMHSIFPHVPMTLAISPHSKDMLGRRADKSLAIIGLRQRGWDVSAQRFPMMGTPTYEAYKGNNFIQFKVTHWGKVEIEKVSIIDENEAFALKKIFRKPYPYKIDNAKGVPEGFVGVRWIDSLGNKWSDNIPKGYFPKFEIDIMKKGGIIKKIDYAKLSPVEDKINSILYNPKSDARYKKVITIEIPRGKAKALDFLKAYTEFNTVGVWKNYKDKNVQVEIEFNDTKNDAYSKKLLSLFGSLNKSKIHEKLIYARVSPVEKSTIDYSLAQAKYLSSMR